MSFKDIYVNHEYMFSLGVEETTGRFYLSIPVSNAMVAYEEYYEIGRTRFDLFQENLEQVLAFVTLCRQRKVDELLMVQPGENRGTAI